MSVFEFEPFIAQRGLALKQTRYLAASRHKEGRDKSD